MRQTTGCWSLREQAPLAVVAGADSVLSADKPPEWGAESLARAE